MNPFSDTGTVMQKYIRHIISLLLLVTGLCSGAVAAESFHPEFTVISPVEGVWTNKQPLILDVVDDCEVYYSFTGSDPLSFGFAYDGPVLIDATGKVSLRLAFVSSSGAVYEKHISYTVQEADGTWKPPFNTNLPFTSFLAGDSIVIPENFFYCLGTDGLPDIPGTVLQLSGGTFPARFVPCTVTDGLRFWRFVIVTDGNPVASVAASVPADSGSPAGEEPPFFVTDWEYLTFNKTGFIYSINDGYWQAAGGTVKIDRSVPCTVSWQSVAYSPDNPVYSVELPPALPEQYTFNGNEAAVFVPGNGYTAAPSNSGAVPVQEISIDAFYGEVIAGTYNFDIYYNGLYQGATCVSFVVDKAPPDPPEIVTNTGIFYNRTPVTVDFIAENDTTVHYTVILQQDTTAGFKADSRLSVADIPEPDNSRYLEYTHTPVTLDARNTTAALYTVAAYTEDAAGNTSRPVVQQFCIDPYNYYLCASSEGTGQDGSAIYPFSSIEDVLSVVKENDFVRIHVEGMVPVTSDVTVASRCEIIGSTAGSGFSVEGNSGIMVEPGANLSVSNCVFEHHVPAGISGDDGILFQVQNATATFSNCEFVSSGSGMMFSSSASTITLRDCGASVTAGSYASLFSGVKTNLAVTGGRYTVIASTGVLFSLSSGRFSLSGTECRVYAHLGRIAELSGVSASITDNQFEAELSGTSAATARVAPIWTDGRSQLMENARNIVSGFPGGAY